MTGISRLGNWWMVKSLTALGEAEEDSFAWVEGDLKLQYTQPQTSDQKRPQDTERLLECRCKWGQMALSMYAESCRDRDPNEHSSSMTLLRVCDSFEEYFSLKSL